MTSNAVIAVVLWVLLVSVAGIACAVGVKKSYTKAKPNGLVLALSCLLLLSLNQVLLKTEFLPVAIGAISPSGKVVDFVAALLVLGIIGAVAILFFLALEWGMQKPSVPIKKGALLDSESLEGESQERPLPVSAKPSTVRRALGGLLSASNALVVVGVAIAFCLLLLPLTPLKDYPIVAAFYTQGGTAKLCRFVQKYTVDFCMVAFLLYMIRKGKEVGFLEGLRKLIVFFGYLFALIFPCVLLFTAPTVEGGEAAFLGAFAKAISHFLFSLSQGLLPAAVAGVVGRLIVAGVLTIFFALLTTLCSWLMKRFVDYVGDVKVLSTAEKILATGIFFVFATSILFVLASIAYTLAYYGVFDCRAFFRPDSPLASAFYGGCEEWLTPLFEEVAKLLAKIG